MDRVRVYPREDEVLDITCYDENATVQELVEAMHWTADSCSLTKGLRMWPKFGSGPCYGCTYCCERFGIYLTNIDAYALALHFGVSVEEFLAYETTLEPWKVNRVRLADPSRLCIGDEGCLLYTVRPLICRLYVCVPHSSWLKRAISEINALGEAALVNIKTGERDDTNPFTDKFSYAQIRLCDCVSPEVWQAIFVGGPPHNLRPVA